MTRLLNIKPSKILLIHFAVMTLSIFTFIIWARLVPENLISFGFTFIIIGFVGGYLFWLYLILTGFNNLDLKNGLKSDLKKSKILLMTILTGYVVFVLIFMLDFDRENNDIPLVINILIAPILTYALFETAITLTKKFKYYDKNTQPNIWDYFVTMFMLSFYPFGLLMMHSHLRLILKDHYIIDI